MESELQVAIDIGNRVHRVAVGDADGRVLDQFDVYHTARGIDAFFARVERLPHDTVAVAKRMPSSPLMLSGPDRCWSRMQSAWWR